MQWVLWAEVNLGLFLFTILLWLRTVLFMASDKAYATEQRLNTLITRVGSGFYTQSDQGAPSETDGDSHQGAWPASGTTTQGSPLSTPPTQAELQAMEDRINLLITALNVGGAIYGAGNAAVGRVNNLIDAHNALVAGSVTSVIGRVNQLQDMLRSAGMMG